MKLHRATRAGWPAREEKLNSLYIPRKKLGHMRHVVHCARARAAAGFSTSRIRIAIFEALVRAFLSLSRRANVKGYTSKFGSGHGVAYFAAELLQLFAARFASPFPFPRCLYPVSLSARAKHKAEQQRPGSRSRSR